jgi:hypothetical protein
MSKCLCKTGPKGLGPRCSKMAMAGSKFCSIHSKKCLKQDDQSFQVPFVQPKPYVPFVQPKPYVPFVQPKPSVPFVQPKGTFQVSKCLCKTGPKGNGPRCSKNAMAGSKFCSVHSKKCLQPDIQSTQPVPQLFQPQVPHQPLVQRKYSEEDEGIFIPEIVAFDNVDGKLFSSYIGSDLVKLHPYYEISVEKMSRLVMLPREEFIPQDIIYLKDYLFKLFNKLASFKHLYIQVILCAYALPLLEHKSAKVIYETAKKIGLKILFINDELKMEGSDSHFEDFYNLLQKNAVDIKTIFAQNQKRQIQRLAQQQKKILSGLKQVHHSDKKEDLIYICGNTEKCRPVKNSDILLKFIDQKQYINLSFMEIIYKTLQHLYPQSCFLHPISIAWEDKNNRFNTLTANQENMRNVALTTTYNIYTHAGRVNESSEVLDVNRYKKDEIDKCFARTSGQKVLPLICIPMSIPGHANMLIIDPNRKEIEHFDPHGANFLDYNYIKLNKKIEHDARHICNLLFPGYTYIPRSDASNFQSVLNNRFQDSIHGGTCAVWSLWYAYLRLSNPKSERDDIIGYARKLLQENNFSGLENFIVKFMKQMTSLIGDSIQQKDDHYMILGRKIIK